MMKTSFLKRKPLAFTLALLLALALITTAGCTNKTGGSDNTPPSVTNSPVAADNTPTPDSRGDLTEDNSERGDPAAEISSRRTPAPKIPILEICPNGRACT